jgi:hypothetical protein
MVKLRGLPSAMHANVPAKIGFRKIRCACGNDSRPVPLATQERHPASTAITCDLKVRNMTPPTRDPEPPPYPAEKARGGRIVLRTPLRRAIFIGGLVGIVVLALILSWAAALQS